MQLSKKMNDTSLHQYFFNQTNFVSTEMHECCDAFKAAYFVVVVTRIIIKDKMIAEIVSTKWKLQRAVTALHF